MAQAYHAVLKVSRLGFRAMVPLQGESRPGIGSRGYIDGVETIKVKAKC